MLCTLWCSAIGSEDHLDLCLENQSGDAVAVEQSDREALVMGLSLHDKAHQMMRAVCSLPVFSCLPARRLLLSAIGGDMAAVTLALP
jgi:hypothetical protein